MISESSSKKTVISAIGLFYETRENSFLSLHINFRVI